MIEYFTKWFDTLAGTADTGNLFLGIWSIGALLLPFAVVVGVSVAVVHWLYWRV